VERDERAGGDSGAGADDVEEGPQRGGREHGGGEGEGEKVIRRSVRREVDGRGQETTCAVVETTGGKNGDTREEQHRGRERERGGVQPARTWSRSFEAGRSRSHHRRARRRGRPAATRIASAAAKCAKLTSTTRAAKRKTIGRSPVSSVAVGDGDVEAMARANPIQHWRRRRDREGRRGNLDG
jgi:hypothetical protein